MTRTDHLDIINEDVIAFISVYKNEVLRIDNTNTSQVLHLLSEHTDLSLLGSLLLAQINGLQPAFIDPRRFNAMRYEEFIEHHHGDFAFLMLPGYADIFKATYIANSPQDRGISYRMLSDIMRHFNREIEFRSRGMVIITIADAVNFINRPVLAQPQHLPKKGKIYIRSIVFALIFIIYWLSTDLNTAAIITISAFVIWGAYKSFKQFVKDVGG